MQNRDDPEVVDHLRQENAYLEAMLEGQARLREDLYKELVARIEETSESALYREGGYDYKWRIEKGADYRQYFRRQCGTEGPWQLYFDAQEEAEGHKYFDLCFLDVSPDGRLLAYAVDLEGDESYTVRFRDLLENRQLPFELVSVCGEGEWDAGSSSYYVVKEDDTRRPYQVWRYRLGQPVETMQCVHEEWDHQFHLELSKSQDGKFLFATSTSKETTEVAWLASDELTNEFSTVFPRRPGIQYFVEHHSGNWLIHTNEDAPDFKLVECPYGNANMDDCRILVPARQDVRIVEILPFRDYIALVERESGLTCIRIRNLKTGEEHRIQMQDPVYELELGINAEFESNRLSYICSSPIRPQEVISYDMQMRSQRVIKSVVVPSGHRPDDYSVYRIQAPACDGKAIPVTLVHCKNFPMDGTGKVYLYAYGAYGETVDAAFRKPWLSYLERGYCIGIAHVRGGGLLGESWYQDGKLRNKKNSFRDFTDVVKELIRQKYTQPAGLAIEGASAGGLLIGAVLNMCPHLFKVAVADVPFVDVLNTMMDGSLPLTRHEYEEWGNPAEKAAFDYIRSYSPYENIASLPYPAILATAGFNDPWVNYWEPAKWVARLRQKTTSRHPVLLKTCFDSGHGGMTRRYQYLQEIALTQAFIISHLEDSFVED